MLKLKISSLSLIVRVGNSVVKLIFKPVLNTFKSQAF